MSKAEAYRKLIEQFLRREISAKEFETTFLSQFKSEPEGMSDRLYAALDRLFGDVDMFCADDELREHYDLDEEALRESCKRAFNAIVKDELDED